VDDGTLLRVHVRQPRGEGCVAAAVLMPPGFEWGERLMETPQADLLVSWGVAVVSFDPRGRGQSEGEEDVNGNRSQDDVAQLLRWVSAREGVDPTRIVVGSRSFGGALAAGALGRHQDLAVTGWVDVESPGYLSEDLAYAPQSNRDHFAELVPSDPDQALAWWSEREPAQLTAGVQVPYFRFQGLPDHALGSRTAAAGAMLKGAVLSPELTYNGQVVTQDQVTPAFIRAAAIGGGVDPDSEQVSQALLGFLGAE